MLSHRRKGALLLSLAIFIFAVTACEKPNSPNFSTEHTVKTPLLADVKMPFLGGADAIIDTTSSQFDSLFVINRQSGIDSGMVSLSKEQDINLGSLGGAVPTISTDPKFINSQLGTIEGRTGEQNSAQVGNFAPDFSGTGTATFQEITNQPAPSAGTPIPAGSNTVPIPLSTSNFRSAVINSGGIKVVFRNNLGMTISSLGIQLYSNAEEQRVAVGDSISNNLPIDHGESYSDFIEFNQGTTLEDSLETEVYLEWNQQQYQGANNPRVEVVVSDSTLIVSQATSDIPQQALNPSTPPISIGDSQFEYAILTSTQAGETLNEIVLEVTNNTPLPITDSSATGLPQLTLRNSNNDIIDEKKELQVEGQPNATRLESGETASVRFDLGGERLTRTMSYSLNLGTAGGQNLQVSSTDEVVVNSRTTDLEVAEAKLSLDSEQMSASNSITMDNNEFKFTQSDHFVELGGGTLVLDSLINKLDMDIPRMNVKIKDIFTPEGDTLEITFSGSSDGPAGSYQYRHIEANEVDEREPIRISMEGFRIKAENNQIDYALSGKTEDTGTRAVTVRSSDEVGAKLQVSDLEVDRARGIITQKEILLNEDDPANGTDVLDLFNDQEAEVQKFEDLEELSNRIGETRFFNTSFDLLYDVNLGVPARLYGVLLGINSEGKRQYLAPKPGSEFAVNNTSFIQGLQVEGQQVDASKVLKLPIETADKIGNLYHGSISFDSTNSTVDEFLSNFPTRIRFIGKAIANPENKEGFIVTPIEFNSSIGFEIPIQLANTAGSEALQDTVDVSLDFLPGGNNSDQTLKRSAIRIKYENMLPLRIDLRLKFLNSRDSVITTAPLPTEDPLRIKAPGIDPQSRFANTPARGEIVIDFTDEQAQKLYKTEKIRLGGSFVTPSAAGSHRVKVRYDDYFQYSLTGDFKLESTVN